jgi:uncharacterized protein
MSQENVEIVKEFTRLFEQGDHHSWRRYFHPDVVWDASSGGLPLSGVYHGYDGIERFGAEWFSAWDDFEVKHLEWIDAGDSVVVIFRQRGRGRGSGVTVEQDYAGIYDFRDQQVARYRMFESRDEALEAAGLSE